MSPATATADLQRKVHVERCMGTVFSVDIRDVGRWDGAIDEVVRWLHHVDAVFSTYRPDSDINRLNRGDLRLADADPLVAEVLDRCAELQSETRGYFSARRTGRIDPTGFVKGWAIERASDVLRTAGSGNHTVNGGGDLQAAGEAAPGEPWRIGISDPCDSGRVLTVVAARDFAVATSGVAERGRHILDPFTGAPADRLAAVSVVGRELSRVDAYATAAFAMGVAALPWLEALPGHAGLIVYPDGRAAATSNFRRFG